MVGFQAWRRADDLQRNAKNSVIIVTLVEQVRQECGWNRTIRSQQVCYKVESFDVSGFFSFKRFFQLL